METGVSVGGIGLKRRGNSILPSAIPAPMCRDEHRPHRGYYPLNGGQRPSKNKTPICMGVSVDGIGPLPSLKIGENTVQSPYFSES